ncbi:uncharacterized protein [Coffea arabica]|uniref:Uncharacterized protein isoform X2 n=1 Tax=Coffea arabica TaxID=13443 RepID=A0ABM4V1C0_COFAR
MLYKPTKTLKTHHLAQAQVTYDAVAALKQKAAGQKARQNCGDSSSSPVSISGQRKMDSTETPLSTSPSHSNFSQQRHFYLAVDRLQFKMETLVDLLGMAGRQPCLRMVVCCSTRDELDAVCSAVSRLSYISIATLYSDQAEAERPRILEKFRQTAINWNNCTADGEEKKDDKEERNKSHMIIVTDACLPLLGMGESPISSRVLINYELPTKKMGLSLIWWLVVKLQLSKALKRAVVLS